MTNKDNKKESGINYYEPVYTIGIASKKLGISPHSFRQYENEGLILSHKTETGRRIYSQMELDKVKCIKKMIQEQGLNFEGIRQLMSMVPCWKLRKCGVKVKKRCYFYERRSKPCWSSEEKCSHPLPDCRDCDVYRKLISCEDIKKFMY